MAGVIEGNEAAMLIEIKNTIRTDLPVLAICAYHRKEDLIVLPELISNISSDYKFYLRKYGTSLRFDSRKCWELVLYAVPWNRVCR